MAVFRVSLKLLVPVNQDAHVRTSRLLYKGGCTSGKQLITDCYELDLSSDPSKNLIPESRTPRQRIEFLNDAAAGRVVGFLYTISVTQSCIFSNRTDGTKWTFTWKSYYSGHISGGEDFFHLMQMCVSTLST